jgi:hypothetical protein
VQIELNESNQDVVFHFDVSERLLCLSQTMLTCADSSNGKLKKSFQYRGCTDLPPDKVSPDNSFADPPF